MAKIILGISFWFFLFFLFPFFLFLFNGLTFYFLVCNSSKAATFKNHKSETHTLFLKNFFSGFGAKCLGISPVYTIFLCEFDHCPDIFRLCTNKRNFTIHDKVSSFAHHINELYAVVFNFLRSTYVLHRSRGTARETGSAT